MSNYQYEEFDIKQFMTSIMWVLFLAQAKLQIWYNKVYDAFLYPVYMSLEKILGLDDETYYDNDVSINTVVKSTVKFLSVMLQYKENETESKEIEINIDPSEYIMGAKLFTSSWITEYIEKNTLLGETGMENYLSVSIFLMGVYFYMTNIIFFVNSIFELNR